MPQRHKGQTLDIGNEVIYSSMSNLVILPDFLSLPHSLFGKELRERGSNNAMGVNILSLLD
jgi:hypothetical protein